MLKKNNFQNSVLKLIIITPIEIKLNNELLQVIMYLSMNQIYIYINISNN